MDEGRERGVDAPKQLEQGRNDTVGNFVSTFLLNPRKRRVWTGHTMLLLSVVLGDVPVSAKPLSSQKSASADSHASKRETHAFRKSRSLFAAVQTASRAGLRCQQLGQLERQASERSGHPSKEKRRETTYKERQTSTLHPLQAA
jgi:hypothetical protein